ncbi:MAG: hypothetical protein IT257_10885, partial [Chitinophagaceae bacterium]|nr:hypothetical protein [Chitinophagaceae bacterium]
GMFQLSVQNQVRRLEFLLKKNQLLVNNKLITPAKDFKIPEQNANSIRSILNYLNKRGEINQIHTWLDEKDQKILSAAIRNNELNTVNAIFTNIHLVQEPVFTYQRFFPDKKFIQDVAVETGEFKQILSFVKYSDEKSTSLCMAEWRDSTLYIFKNNDTLVKQSFNDLTQKLQSWGKRQDSLEYARIPLSTRLQILSNEQFKNYNIATDSLIISQEKYKILFNLIELYRQDTNVGLKDMNGYLLY